MSELKVTPIAAKLRASVLQQAVEGRLVPQDPDDEPSSVLLERIREERAELVKQKKAKAQRGGESRIHRGTDGSWYEQRGKAKPVCIDKDIPFDIPENWEWSRMSVLIELLSGVDLTPSEYNDRHNGIPYITGASNFDDGTLIENRWTVSPRRVSHEGDLLFTCKGTVGDMAINSFERAHIARQVMAVCPIDYEMLPYIEIVLSAQVERIKNAAKGLIPGIERKTILDGLVSLPPLAEQQRIVERINEIMPLIDRSRKRRLRLRKAANRESTGVPPALGTSSEVRQILSASIRRFHSTSPKIGHGPGLLTALKQSWIAHTQRQSISVKTPATTR